MVVGIDVPAAARTADRGVQALRGEVERHASRPGSSMPRAAVGGDLRMPGGERRLHHRRRLDREALHAAAGRGQGDRQRGRARRRGASPRGGGEDAGERVAVERQRAEATRRDRRRGAVARRRRTAGDVLPGAGRARGGASAPPRSRARARPRRAASPGRPERSNSHRGGVWMRRATDSIARGCHKPRPVSTADRRLRTGLRTARERQPKRLPAPASGENPVRSPKSVTALAGGIATSTFVPKS